MHMRMHMFRHAQCMHKRTLIRTYARKHVRSYTHIHVHTDTHAHTNTCMHARRHTHNMQHACACTRIHARVHNIVAAAVVGARFCLHWGCSLSRSLTLMSLLAKMHWPPSVKKLKQPQRRRDAEKRGDTQRDPIAKRRKPEHAGPQGGASRQGRTAEET